ncbi:YitT family protein [Alkalicoccobacillus porphyridii]|uniref:YitT family protein n=1 Tax=Alkalicoccobacillus porphyridii TaxID=2597270 RepID=A0A553ZU92_9BACI|nr:YitT family protein [Alkalicoccobacillus porphyridii]TSB45050.1 YitT family protein [Alkalicoccobacillus porphyridii]
MRKWIHIWLGCFVVACGVLILKHSDLVTGGTAGLSLGLSYLTQLPFALLFFVINIPFYIFSVIRMGLSFTVTTILSVSLLSVLTAADVWLPSFVISYWSGALIGGVLIGLGLSLLFRNQASLGGSNILALFLQKRYGFDPGKTNFLFDLMVVLTSVYTIGIVKGFFSIVSIAVTSRIISYFKQGNVSKKPVVKEEYVLPGEASLSK